MKKIVLSFIRFYQKHFSLTLHGLPLFGCRFTPTCSEYTYQSIEKYGTMRGLFLGLKRILRCHPFSQGGFDPVK